MNRRGLGLLVLSMEVLAFFPRSARGENATTSAQAWDLGGARDPRTIAMAGGGDAVAGGTQAALANPAGLVLSKGYELELAGTWMPEAGLAHYGGAIADSVTSRIGGGVSAHYMRFDTATLARSALDVRGSVAFPLGDALALGAALRLLRVEDARTSGAVGGESVARADAERLRFGLDAGLVLRPVAALRIGLLAKNLLVDPGFDMPRIYSAGAGLTIDGFTLESSALVNTTLEGSPKWRSSTGLAWAASERYAVHFGYRFDEGYATHAIGAGVSIFDRNGALEIAARRDVAGAAPTTFISVGIRALMASAGRSDGGDFGL